MTLYGSKKDCNFLWTTQTLRLFTALITKELLGAEADVKKAIVLKPF